MGNTRGTAIFTDVKDFTDTEKQPKRQHCEGKPNLSFISYCPQNCTYSHRGYRGTSCPAWVSGAEAVQQDHRQCEPQTRFWEGATGDLKITSHVLVNRTSSSPAPYSKTLPEAPTQPSQDPRQDKMSQWLLLHCCLLGSLVWTNQAQKALQRSPKQQPRQVYLKARRRQRKSPTRYSDSGGRGRVWEVLQFLCWWLDVISLISATNTWKEKGEPGKTSALQGPSC